VIQRPYVDDDQEQDHQRQEDRLARTRHEDPSAVKKEEQEKDGHGNPDDEQAVKRYPESEQEAEANEKLRGKPPSGTLENVGPLVDPVEHDNEYKEDTMGTNIHNVIASSSSLSRLLPGGCRDGEDRSDRSDHRPRGLGGLHARDRLAR
jgi:hypothetical protein